jgi:hypothetical protein
LDCDDEARGETPGLFCCGRFSSTAIGLVSSHIAIVTVFGHDCAYLANLIKQAPGAGVCPYIVTLKLRVVVALFAGALKTMSRYV